MKKSIKYTIIFSIILIIVLAFFHPLDKILPLQSWVVGKPILRVRVINFDADGKQEGAVPHITQALEEKYYLKYVDSNYDILINGFLGRAKFIPEPNAIQIHYTTEVYAGDPKKHLEDYDLVTAFDFVDHTNYIRVPFYYTRYTDRIRHDYDRNRGTCNPAAKKHFACFLASNSGDWLKTFDGAQARTRMFHRLSLYKKVISGGKHLNNIGERVSYDGTEEWLSQCKFVIAYENQSYPGYITEKPFQAYFAGAIPIYYAHKDSLVDINTKSVILANDFATEEDLVEYIKKVDNDDELYCKIWNEKMLVDPAKDYEAIKSKIRVKLEKILSEKLNK